MFYCVQPQPICAELSSERMIPQHPHRRPHFIWNCPLVSYSYLHWYLEASPVKLIRPCFYWQWSVNSSSPSPSASHSLSRALYASENPNDYPMRATSCCIAHCQSCATTTEINVGTSSYKGGYQSSFSYSQPHQHATLLTNKVELSTLFRDSGLFRWLLSTIQTRRTWYWGRYCPLESFPVIYKEHGRPWMHIICCCILECVSLKVKSLTFRCALLVSPSAPHVGYNEKFYTVVRRNGDNIGA